MSKPTRQGRSFNVIPAKAGIQVFNLVYKKWFTNWIPAFAGMTNWIISIFFTLIFLNVHLSADDPINVQIERVAGRFNLGISEFVSDENNVDVHLLSATREVIKGDLAFSRLFNLVDQGPTVSNKVKALEWTKFGTEIVLAASLKGRGGNQVEISVQLFDTSSGKENLSFSKKRPLTEVRVLSHEISNEVVKYFTGQPGIFNSRIAYVNDATGRKELYLADYDGGNPKRLTNDNSIVILPRISPDGKKVIFTSYRSGNPDLYIMNIDGTGRRKLSAKAGLNVSPSWAPSSEELALTLSIHGPPNIYLLDLQGNIKRHLTDGQGADTAPSFSPDGTQLAFTSDRASAPHIYVMNIDGSGLRRFTTASHCDSAAWSSDGQTLVYVKGGDGASTFDIYSIEVLTGIERRLTWGEGNNENPAWSPDGRCLLFTSSRRKKSELFVMSADGSEQRPLGSMSGQSFTPHWSK